MSDSLVPPQRGPARKRYSAEDLAKYHVAVSVGDKIPHLKTLLYGHKKVGKTVMACKIGKRPLLVAMDPGWVALRDWDELHHVQVVEYQGLRHLNFLAEALYDPEGPYAEIDHVIFDPWSTACQDYMAYLATNFKVSSDTRVTFTPTREAMNKGEVAFSTTGINDYNALVTNWRPAVSRLSLVQKDVTYICHVKDPSFLAPKDRAVRPNLPGAMYSMLSKNVGVIAHMEANGNKRTVSVEPTADVEAGSWIRSLHGTKVDANDFPKIIENWKEGKSHV